MVKKGLGALLIVVAALILIGSIANGSLIGTVIPIGVYIFAGIFLITFDGIYKKAFIEGFKARKSNAL